MFHLHKWTKWKELHQSDIVNSRTGGILGYAFIQNRHCERCGLIQYKQKRITVDE